MRIAIIGAQSRAAQAFIRFARAKRPDAELIAFARRSLNEAVTVKRVQVADYSAIGAPDLAGCDTIINFVGAVRAKSVEELYRVNAELPVRLCAEARTAGVPHFIHLSSLSVHGRAALIGPNTPVAPVSDYGRSKAEAERNLAALAENGPTIILVRFPTLYGPGEPSKLASLAGLLERLPVFPVPRTLPNRSIISHDNLARILLALATSPREGVVYAADPEPFRLDRFAALLRSPARLVPMPSEVLKVLRLAVPGLYNSVYESMEIEPSSLFSPDLYPLRSTAESLADMIGNRQPPA